MALLLVSPAQAKKTHVFQERFGSAAQPIFPSAGSLNLTVDPATGDLLVADEGAGTLSRFHPDGTPANFSALGTNVIDAKRGPGNKPCPEEASSCDQSPQGGFRFLSTNNERQITVDNSGTATDGDIYVTQGGEAAGNLLDIFAADGHYLGQLTAAGTIPFGTTGSFPFSSCGVAVDEAGNLYLGGGYDNEIYKFDPSANPPVNSDLVATFPTAGLPAGEVPCSIAAGSGSSAGSLFVSERVVNGNGRYKVTKLDSSSGARKYVLPATNATLPSIDPQTGHLYVAGNSEIDEYDVSGTEPVLVSSTPAPFNETALAVDGPRLYLENSGNVGGRIVDVFGPIVTLPDVATGSATITGDTTATLRGTVNPDGVELTECRFEYGPATTYGESVPCAETPAQIGAGHSPVEVHAELSGLAPESLYHFRLLATNAEGFTSEGADKTLQTPSKPSVEAEWSVDVAFTEATLAAQINPQNSETQFRLEWGAGTSYGSQTPLRTLATGVDAESHTVRVPVDQLVPGTTYHYRFVAVNSIGTTEGPDHTFTTYSHSMLDTECPNQSRRGGTAAALPDCRAYELVSPLDKNGSDAVAGQYHEQVSGMQQATPDGGALTYSANNIFGEAVSSPPFAQYIATRSPSGWTSQSIDPPRSSQPLITPPLSRQMYYGFTSSLCQGWFIQDTDVQLVEGAPVGLADLYRRDGLHPGCGEAGYALLTNVAPLNTEGIERSNYVPQIEGFSADGQLGVFRVRGALTSNADAGTDPQLYATSGSRLRLVSALPNGAAATGVSVGPPTSIAFTAVGESDPSRAVSADGSRVFWSGGEHEGHSQLYVRVNPIELPSLVSSGKCTQPARACTVGLSRLVSPDAEADFVAADPSGSLALFTLGSTLYEVDVDKAVDYEPGAVTAVASGLPGEGATAVLGASEDASRVFFLSTQDLGAGTNPIGDSAVVGRKNLYLYQRGQGLSFVATFDSLGTPELELPAAVTPLPHSRAGRVTPDGLHVVFPSRAPLTGYDNLDATSGEPDSELFLYDAAAGGAPARLRCVSCNPSGARPLGRLVGGRINGGGPLWSAAEIRGWQSQFQPTRNLSADGARVFFESFDPLLPTDTNGVKDIYQWEASGSGDCEQGAPNFFARDDGCLSLLSSGKSPQSSRFLDASADGSDVFFQTASSLLPEDPGLIDIYDARADGGFPTPPAPAAACEGEACQGPLAAPADPTPASSTFHGAGNIREPASGRCRRGAVRHKGKCTKRHHRHRKHKRFQRKHRHAHHRAANRNRRTGS